MDCYKNIILKNKLFNKEWMLEKYTFWMKYIFKREKCVKSQNMSKQSKTYRTDKIVSARKAP